MRFWAVLLLSSGLTLQAGVAPQLRFEPNQGQADPSVRFVARGAGYSVFLEEDGSAVHVLLPRSDAPAQLVRMRLLEGQPKIASRGEDQLPSVTRFYSGSDPEQWHPDIPHYGRVRFPGVYPGIDLIWRGGAGELEYQFLIAAGADPTRICLGFEGERGVALDAEGNLVVDTAGGTLRYRSPHAWQDLGGQRTPVAVSFEVNGEVVSFRLGSYDHERPLLIDPVLGFSSYVGGAGYDAGYGIALDTAGNLYLTGETASSDFLLPTGGVKSTRLNRDVFITKLSANGSSVLYTTILASNANDAGRGIAVDASGNAYVTGVAGSSNFPVTGGAFRTVSGGAEDAFVAKLNSSGKLTYSTFLGGSGTDAATGIAVDTSGNTYVTGYTASTNFPVTPGVPQTTYKGGFYDAFVTKLNSTGTALVYSTLLGGSGNDQGRAVALGSGNITCIAGRTDSIDLVAKNAFQASAGGSGDAMIGCLNAAGTAWNYLTYLGGPGPDEAFDLAVDSAGYVSVTGTTHSPSFPVTIGAYQTTRRNDYDAFVTKLSTSGNTLVYSTLLGGSGSDAATTIAVDASSRAWIAGYTTSTDFPQQSSSQSGYRGSFDGFVSQLSADGSTLSASGYLGGAADDRAWGLALNSTGDIFVTGYTNSLDFPTTAGTVQPVGPGSYNVFVVKLPAIVAAQMLSPSPSSTLAGSTVTFTWASVPDAVSYWLEVGSSIGLDDISAGASTSSSRLVTNLPCDGRTIYVRLWTNANGIWLSPLDYTYTTPMLVRMISPIAGTALTATSVTFSWTGTGGASGYWLGVGTTLGSSDLSAGITTSTSRTVNTLPCDGRTLYVRLWTNLGGTWQTPLDYTYTACSSAASYVQRPRRLLPGPPLLSRGRQ